MVTCGVGRRFSSDLALLWLWHSLAAVALIPPLAWELPYVAGTVLKKQTERKKRKRKRRKKERKKGKIDSPPLSFLATPMACGSSQTRDQTKR